MLHVDTRSLWSQLHDDLRGYVARRVPTANVDDVLQDIFLRVHERRGQLRDGDRVAPWVFRIARSVVVDHLRGARPTEPEATDVVQPDEEDDVQSSARVLATWLAAMVNTLPETYREAIELTDLQGMSQADAAAQVGVSYSGFKSRVQRGRAKLRQILNRCCVVELDRLGGVIDYRGRAPDCC